MYAIIKSGSKQYRVQKGDFIDIDLQEAEEGQEIQFGEALVLNDGKKTKIGSPTVGKSSVTGKVIGVVPGPKISSIKYKPSHNQWRKFGHRQKYLRVEITAIA